MKVTALIFCLALVPFVAAQGEPEQPAAAGLLETLQGFWDDLTSKIEVQRYREDLTARYDAGVTLIKKGWNNTLDIIEDLKVEAGDLDMATAEEVKQQMADSFEELDQFFSEMQNTIQVKLEELKEQMPAIDIFGILPDEDNANEGEAEPEPEPTPEPEQPESGLSWKWW